MPEELKQIAGVAGAPLIVWLVQMTKITFPDLQARWFPSLAVFYAVIINVLLAVLLHTDPYVAAFVGLITGWAAMKLYEAGKRGETVTDKA